MGYQRGPLALKFHEEAGLDEGIHGHLRTRLRTDPGGWQEVVFSTDDAVTPSSPMSLEHGQFVARGSGGTGARANRRTARIIPGSTGGYSRIRSRLSGTPANPAVVNIVPQRGHAHGIQQVGGLWQAVVVTHDIAFSVPQVINLSVWRQETAPGGVGAVFDGTGNADNKTVTAAVRTSNVVTLTLANPAGNDQFVTGDLITVDLANNSYDGTFPLTGFTTTSVTYSHTGTDLGTSTGGCALARSQTNKIDLVRSTAVTASSRTSGVVTATVAAGHPWNLADTIQVDLAVASYDGVFQISGLPSSTQIQWKQAAADDAAGGAGSISNQFPYWLETEWLPGMVRARVWPDSQLTAQGGLGSHSPAGVPSWESMWGLVGPLPSPNLPLLDPTKGIGCGLVTAHLAGGAAPTEVRYDGIQVSPLA